MAESVRSGVESRPLTITREGHAQVVPVSVSVGVAYFPDEAVSLTDEELVRRAYDALLRAKEAGGNTVCVYSEIEERDPLTDTLKRAGILARFEQARVQADAARTSASIINLDIDEFELDQPAVRALHRGRGAAARGSRAGEQLQGDGLRRALRRR